MTCCNRCCECARLIKSTSIAITGTAPNQVLTVMVPSMAALENLDKVCLVFAQTIPVGTYPVVITDGTLTFNVFNSSGNYLRADEIRSRKRYKGVFGNDPNHITLITKVCNTSFIV